MKLIRFPGATPPPTQLSGDTVLDPNQRLAVGPVSFTCTSCDAVNTADFSNMVFRSLEFYCLSCGSPFRVCNPAFSHTRSKK